MNNKNKILIIDDDIEVIKAVLRILLAENSFDIQYATNGDLIEDKIIEFMPDVVLLDVMMPEQSGKEIGLFIRNELNGNKIKIIAISGSLERGQELTIKEWADDYLEKPFDNKILLEKIKTVLAS